MDLNIGFCSFSIFEPPLETIRRAARMGMQLLELKVEFPESSDWNFSPEELKEVEKLGIEVRGHASIYDVNIASLNEGARRSAVAVVLRCIERASLLGVKSMVIHGGRLPADFPAQLLPRAKELAVESIQSILDQSVDWGGVLCIENANRYRLSKAVIATAEDQREIVDRIASPRLKAVLDTGHAFTFGADLVSWIDLLGDRLFEIHVHDNFGEGDEHLIPGTGRIDWEPFFAALAGNHLNPSIILELRDESSIKQGEEFVRLQTATGPDGVPKAV
jgi:sugar phosphate isomerase/epimerase